MQSEIDIAILYTKICIGIITTFNFHLITKCTCKDSYYVILSDIEKSDIFRFITTLVTFIVHYQLELRQKM